MLIVRCWGHFHLISDVPASASTDDVKDIISKGIGISSDKLTLYVCAHVCSFDEGQLMAK